tara:strand:+ start:561 stop:1085 length:525 start_codon:yes stop_codon:yes gene_type:complete
VSKIVSAPGIEVTQKNFHQIIIRGNGLEKFNNIIEEKTSIKPPSKNLEVKYDNNYLFAKNSPDQWSLVLTEKKEHNQVINLVSSINVNEDLLASDYSYGQVYFEIEGENKDKFLNKLTHFDLREEKFPKATMAQTIVARIDCSIYNLGNKYVIICNKSFEDYFQQRLKDTANLN